MNKGLLKFPRGRAMEEVAPPWVGVGHVGATDVGPGGTNAQGILTYVPVSFTAVAIGYRVFTQAGNIIFGLWDGNGMLLYQEPSFPCPAPAGAIRRVLGSPVLLPQGPLYMFIHGDNAALSIGMAPITAGGTAYFFANTFADGFPARLPALSETDDTIAITAIRAGF